MTLVKTALLSGVLTPYQRACMSAMLNVLAECSAPEERQQFSEEVGRALMQKVEEFAANRRCHLMRAPVAKQ
jgi:hypothetical protein